jgi:hypothetical protein
MGEALTICQRHWDIISYELWPCWPACEGGSLRDVEEPSRTTGLNALPHMRDSRGDLGAADAAELSPAVLKSHMLMLPRTV